MPHNSARQLYQTLLHSLRRSALPASHVGMQWRILAFLDESRTGIFNVARVPLLQSSYIAAYIL